MWFIACVMFVWNKDTNTGPSFAEFLASQKLTNRKRSQDSAGPRGDGRHPGGDAVTGDLPMDFMAVAVASSVVFVN